MTTYGVDGMTCDGCARSVENAIKNRAPQASVSVSVDRGEVTVTGLKDDALVAKAVADAGFDFRGPQRR